MNDDALIDLILLGMGVTASDPNYQTYRNALRARADAESAVQGRWFSEDIRRFDEGQQRQKDALENQYRMALLSAENQQEANAINRWKAEKDYEIDQQRVGLDRDRLGLDRDRLGLDQGAQGLDLLRTQVDLNSQVRDWAKLADWEAGVASSGNGPAFLQSLLANTASSAGSAAPRMTASPGMPQQNSLGAVLADMGVSQGAPAAATNTAGNAVTDGGKTPPTPQQAALKAIINNWTPSGTQGWDPNDVAALKSIGALAAVGEQKYANTFAQLDEDDQDFILGGQARLGRNPARVARDLDRFRIGNSASGVAA